MNAVSGRAAVAFVERHGLVMQSARVPGVPSLVDFIVGESVRGSWWGHPKGGLVFRVLGEVYESPDVLAMRLVRGKLTLVHRRLWPALVRLAARIGEERLAAVGEEHTPSGRHVATRLPYPGWVGPELRGAAAALGEEDDCLSGSTKCGGTCVVLGEDNLNCGACGTACATGRVCSAGTCALSCQAGLADCSGSCRDLQSDRANCGGCGTVCIVGQVCSSGACTARTWEVKASTPINYCPGLTDFIPAGQTSVYALEYLAFAVYDPASDAWAALANAPLSMGCFPGTARMGDTIYTIKAGGVYGYSISSGVWTTNVASGLQDTWAGQSTGDDSGFVYAMTSGGTGTILQYDTATGTVNTFAGPADVTGEPRAAWDSLTKLVYLGDFSNPLFYAFDPATGAVISLAPSPEPGDAFCSDRRGHVFRTGSNCSGSQTVWAYTAATGTWARLPDLPFDTGCNAACTVSSDGWLYFAGDGNFARIALS